MAQIDEGCHVVVAGFPNDSSISLLRMILSSYFLSASTGLMISDPDKLRNVYESTRGIKRINALVVDSELTISYTYLRSKNINDLTE